MEFMDVVRNRKSIRKFKDLPVEKEKIEEIIRVATYAPSACNEQLWDFIIINNHKLKKELVNKAGTATLILKSPVVIVVYYHQSNFPANIESVSAAVQNMVLAATNIGLGSLWIGAVGNRKKVSQLLGVPDDRYLVCFVSIGYPDENPIPPTRRPISDVVHVNVFQGEHIKVSHNPNNWSIDDIVRHNRYICRKTSLGRAMEVLNDHERRLISKVLTEEVNNGDVILDLFSYDGSFLGCFPNDKSVVSFELSDQTALYTKFACKNSFPVVFRSVFPIKSNSVSVITMLLKIERIPRNEWELLFSECHRVLKDDGQIIIMFRDVKTLYGVFYKIFVKLFGDDIHKTAIYAYFGPYAPINGKKLSISLKKIGFKLEKDKYFLVPPVFAEYILLVHQYFLSSGTSFLNMKAPKSHAYKLFCKVIDMQPDRKSSLGHLCVIKAKKVKL